MITCNLVEISEYVGSRSIKKKYGRYHGSSFWDIKGYGNKKWVVGAYIEIQDPALFEKLPKEEIVRGCLETLNTPPPRKKYAKKAPQPKYGVLEHYKSQIVEKFGKKMLSVLLITDKKKNKLFWGKG